MRGRIPPGSYKSLHIDESYCCQAVAVNYSEAWRNSWPWVWDVWGEVCVQWRVGEAEGDMGVGPGWGTGGYEGSAAKSAEEEWDCNPDLGIGLCTCLGNLGAAAPPASGVTFYCYYSQCDL